MFIDYLLCKLIFFSVKMVLRPIDAFYQVVDLLLKNCIAKKIDKHEIYNFITYANNFPYIILFITTDQYFSISGVYDANDMISGV